MSPFTKLDRGILQSSIMAEDPTTFKVWITLLAACDPDGTARVSAIYIASVARLPLEDVRKAIQILEGPDPESRSTNNAGARVRRVDGGYEIINYLVYRQRSLREAEAERKRLYRRDNPSIAAAENYRRRHPTQPQSSDPDSDGEREGEGEPSHVRPDGHGRTPEGQTPAPDQDGLLPIPKGIAFKLQDELVEERAEIRHLARMIELGRRQDGPDRLSPEGLERRRQGFNQRIKDLMP